MDLQKEYFACLALKHTPRLGAQVWKQLFAIYPSAYDAVQDAAFWLARGVENRFIKAAAKGCATEVWREKAEEEFKATSQAGMDVVTWFDPRYPDSLREIHDPPALLYVCGDTTLFRNPGIAVVGARECTALGLETACRISAQLSRVGITVVSGLALGIDRQAHLGGLRGIGSSIAVLGCGLDIDYPSGNFDVRSALERKGLVVTEFGPGVEPRANHFPVRNRLISGLSLGVLVAEAAHRSGSLITARLAAEQGRDVFALPGPIGQPTFTGCHRLIKQGAALVESAEDIVEILRYDFARELADIPDPDPELPEEDSPLEESAASVPSAKSPAPQKKAAPKKKSAPKKKAVPEKQPEKAAEKPSRKRPLMVEREDMKLNDDERAVMDRLVQADKIHIDALGRELDWTAAKVSKVLIMLEMRGAVQQLPGLWYLAREDDQPVGE